MGTIEEWYGEPMRAQLRAGEELRGILVANQTVSMFKQQQLAIGVTDARLLLMPTDRRGKPKGEVRSVEPADLAEVKGGSAGNASSPAGAIVGASANQLKIKLRDGEKLKLAFMHGGGPFSLFKGADEQKAGVDAIEAWLGAHAPR